MHTTRPFLILATLFGLLLTSACSREQAAETDSAAAEDMRTADAPAALPRTASPQGATVFFITPGDGDTVPNPISIEFGIDGMSVVAAGVNAAHSGHHHLLVDTDPPAMGLPIPADSNHIHFGDGSTSTELTLAPGEHTLRLLLGDHAHIPHNPPIMSEPITITVK